PDRIDIDSLLSEVDAGWDEWVLEAENDEYSGAHCSVFVLRPLPESAQLVEREEKIVGHIPLDEYLRHGGVKLLPDESVEPVDYLPEDAEIDLRFDQHLPERLAQAGIGLNRGEPGGLCALMRDGVTIWSTGRELRSESSRLLAAEVVLINLHNQREYVRAEATRTQILHLYSNWKLRYQLDFRSRVARAGVYLANLQDAVNPETQKAL